MFTSLVLKRTLASVPFAAAVVAAVTCAGPAAQATIAEQIDVPGTALTGFTGPYATVSVSRVGDLSVSGASALGAAAAADLAGGGFSASFSGVNSLGTLDGFSNVSLGFYSGYPDAENLVNFLITSTTGLWASDAAVLMNNAGGYSAAIRAFACTPPCIRPAGALATGLVGR
jgi:hypothetical protein